jgi:hypothetical protein
MMDPGTAVIYASIPPTVASLIAAYYSWKNKTKIQEIHVSINGQLGEFKKTIAKASHAEGVAEERASAEAKAEDHAAGVAEGKAGAEAAAAADTAAREAGKAEGRASKLLALAWLLFISGQLFLHFQLRGPS